jgi:TonB family protein
MIRRILVPVDVRPVSKDEAKNHVPHRVTTYLDDRTVVPSGPSDAPPLDGRTTIPSYLPLDVLVTRTLVARGMDIKPLERLQRAPSAVSLEVLDSRTVVPAEINPLTAEDIKEFERPVDMTSELREMVNPDIFTTGDANLLIEPEEKKDAKWDAVTRVLSILVHIGLIAFLIFIPRLFPPPTQEEIAKDQLPTNWIYSPPSTPEPAPPTPKVRVDAKTLSRIAPPAPQPPTPQPPAPAPKPAAELPEAPTPKIPVAPTPAPEQPTSPQPSRLEPVQPAATQPNNRLNLQLPQGSPGKMLDDQIDSAIRHGSQGGIAPGGQAAPGAGGGPGMGYGVQILSDTQGFDFNPYIQRLLASLKRNWEAVMPESARMGDRGSVFTSFTINRDGSVSSPDPVLDRTSGKDPLDNAAMSAIHASNPFEPLPSGFHGQNLRLRIVFLYNLPLDAAR